MRLLFSALLMVWSVALIAAEEIPEDPLGSIQWDDMYRAYLKEHKVVFDDRVKVLAPEFAEDSMNVPVTVDASEIKGIKEILVFAEFNPISKILKFYPGTAKATFSFRFKIQQASPVRAAVLTHDGVWHVGGVWVDAAGGGCTVASAGRLGGGWEDHLGEVHTKIWEGKDYRRVKFSVVHPMDTGLVASIPAFYIEEIKLTDDSGELLARVELFEPVQENPVLTLDLAKGSSVYMDAIDNNANEFSVRLVQ